MMVVVHEGSGDALLRRITLAVFFYNQARFAEETVRSVFAQTYGNVEILLSDDGSSDGTGVLLMSLAKSYSGPHRVVVNINEANLGFGRHFAVAVRMCTGEWIATQGGDDLAEQDRLSILGKYVDLHPDAMAIGCAGARIDESGNVIGVTHAVPSLYKYDKYSGGPFRMANLPEPPGMVELTPVLGATAAYRRSVVIDPPFPDDVADEDLLLSLRAISRGAVLMIPECLVRRRVNINSLSFYKKSTIPRNERRHKRLKISQMRYFAYRAACRELLSEEVQNSELGQYLRAERARALLQCFEEPIVLDSLALYKNGYRDALKNHSWFRLAEDALGRGKLRAFLRAWFMVLVNRGI